MALLNELNSKMRIGTTEQLATWITDIILSDPEYTLLVALPDSRKADQLVKIVSDRLFRHPSKIGRWKFGDRRIRTDRHGFIEFTAGKRDRLVRGYKVDEFLAHHKVSQSIIDTGKWTEKNYKVNIFNDQIIGEVVADTTAPTIVRSAVVATLERLKSLGVLAAYDNVDARLLDDDPTMVEVRFSYKIAPDSVL